MKFKHFFVRVALVLLRTTLTLKLNWIARPFITVGTFLFRTLFVPVYRLTFLIRRQMSRLYLPAKNRLLFFFSNRWAIHGAIVLIALWSTLLNAGSQGARAQGLGDNTILLSLLGDEGDSVTEEVSGSAQFVSQSLTYEDQSSTLSSPTASSIDYGFISGTSSTVSTGLSAPLAGTIPQQQIKKPSSRMATEKYTVADGDTISSIADKFGLSITTILWANDLSVRSFIHAGDTLTILPVDGVVHKVKNGDTLSRIAALYGVTSAAISDYNGKVDANDLSIGEALVIPGGERHAPTPSRRVASVSSIFAPSPGGGSSASAGPGGMIWPSDLHKINLYFGVLYFLGRHTGIDIDCNSRNTNYAAADGIVHYAGWRRGYGYAVEIDHGNGIMTRYGHNAKLYVSTGQSVAQGTPIALCGSTGNSTGTHLHFEVIVNGRFVNPLGYIQ